jgi:hypothetical protein
MMSKLRMIIKMTEEVQIVNSAQLKGEMQGGVFGGSGGPVGSISNAV